MAAVASQKCNKCGQVYPITREFFGQTKQKSGRVTFRQVCRACMRANTARHYAEAPEKVVSRVERMTTMTVFSVQSIESVLGNLIRRRRSSRKETLLSQEALS